MEEGWEIQIDAEQNGKQVSETMTEKQADRLRRAQPIDTAWLMYLCLFACVCARVYANASSEIILCGLLCPRSVGTSLGFHRYRSPGTRTDRQADGETVDHQGLVQRFSKPLSPIEQHIDPCLQVSSFKTFKILTQKDPVGYD